MLNRQKKGAQQEIKGHTVNSFKKMRVVFKLEPELMGSYITG